MDVPLCETLKIQLTWTAVNTKFTQVEDLLYMPRRRKIAPKWWIEPGAYDQIIWLLDLRR